MCYLIITENEICILNGGYFTEDNKFMIQKAFNGKWDVYRAFKPFMGEYQITFKYLKDAKKYVLDKYNA